MTTLDPEVLEQALERLRQNPRGYNPLRDEAIPEHQRALLVPYIEQARRLFLTPRPQPSAQAMLEARARMHRALEQQRRRAFGGFFIWLNTLTHRSLSTLGAALATVVLIIAVGIGGYALTMNSLPGQPLYTVKRSIERAALGVAPPQQEVLMHARLSVRRLNEFTTLVERGVYRMDLITAYLDELRAARQSFDTLPPSARDATRATMLDMLTQAENTLAQWVNRVPPQYQPILSQAYVETQRMRATFLEQQVLPTATPPPTLGPSISSTPTLTPTLPGVSGPTATPTWTPLATPTPSPTIAWTPSATPSPTPTPSITPIFTPTPTPLPTSTPTPSAAMPARELSPTPTPVPTRAPTPTWTLPPTPTPTPTWTSLPTSTPTLTPTWTPLPTPTPTLTPTWTLSPTPTPTWTPVPTPTPTWTPLPTATPTPTWTWTPRRPTPTPTHMMPTHTPRPTPTHGPRWTPTPTPTPEPTETEEPEPTETREHDKTKTPEPTETEEPEPTKTKHASTGA